MKPYVIECPECKHTQLMETDQPMTACHKCKEVIEIKKQNHPCAVCTKSHKVKGPACNCAELMEWSKKQGERK